MKWTVEVQWVYKAFDYATLEVEAVSASDAEEKALAMAEAHEDQMEWADGQVFDGKYEVNRDETFPIREIKRSAQ